MVVDLKPERWLVAPRLKWREARGETMLQAAIFEQIVIKIPHVFDQIEVCLLYCEGHSWSSHPQAFFKWENI